MSSGNDWMMRPVLAGLVDYVELGGTRLDLADFAEMNEALDVHYENRRRLTKVT